MKKIKTNGIYYLSPVGSNSNWYWGMDDTSGDLYEAAELYKNHQPIKQNRAIYVRYPEGSIIEPIVAKENQYLGVPSLDYNEKIYTLLVDFAKGEIQIMSFQPDEILNGGSVQVVDVLPLSIAKDCYNLLLKSAPVMLTRQTQENYFQILWSEAAGRTNIGFQYGRKGIVFACGRRKTLFYELVGKRRTCL